MFRTFCATCGSQRAEDGSCPQGHDPLATPARTAAPSTRIATRRTNKTRHVVTGVPRWFSGMLGRTECGVRNVDVHEEQAKRGDDLLCRRCTRVLGWTR